MKFLQQNITVILFLVILIFSATGGFYQLTSGLFYCGVTAAMPEILYWSVIVGFQSLLFMFAPLNQRMERLYLLSQIIALPLLVLVVAQLADTYPRPFIAIGVMLGIYCYLRFIGLKSWKKPLLIKEKINPIKLLAEGSLFIATTLLIHSTLAFLVLHTQGARLSDSLFWGIYLCSIGVSYFLVRKGCYLPDINLSKLPPVFLLVFFLLRAKLPDLAYDSLFYKATVPIMIADWRTALTGIIDHTLLGTNFLEIINSQLRIFDPTYSPAMTSTFAYIGLWIMIPWAATSFLRNSNDLAANASVLLFLSLTESLTAAGTSYQEPFIVLLIALSLLAGPLGWFMIACAVSVKITVLFFVPLWVIWRLMTVDRKAIFPILSKTINILRLKHIKALSHFSESSISGKSHKISSLQIAIVVSLFLAFFVVGEQLYRNYVFTGRILAPSEALVSITDPDGKILKRIEKNQVFDSLSEGGRFYVFGTTMIHMLTLDKIIKPSELGFHVFPSSRLPVVAILLCLLLLSIKAIRKDKRFIIISLLYSFLFVVFLGFFSQGRHMAAASTFAIFVVVSLLNHFSDPIEEKKSSLSLMSCIAFGLTFFAVSDQMVGSYINDGWECRRPLISTPVKSEYEKVDNEVERILANVVQNYRSSHGTVGGVLPSITCESQIERQTYFGAHYVYTYTSQSMLKNYLDVDAKRAELLPYSLLAVCFENEQFFTDLIPQNIREQYVSFAKVGNVSIMVSKPLTSSGAFAQSVTNKGLKLPLIGTDNKIKVFDFVRKWENGEISDKSPTDTPTGKGAFKLAFDNVDSAILVSPYTIQFSNISFAASDSIDLEYAMPYSNSDGMEVRLIVAVKDQQYVVELPVSPRSENNNPMAWKQSSIKLPAQISGEGIITISALSSSGDSSADWVAFRNISIARTIQ